MNVAEAATTVLEDAALRGSTRATIALVEASRDLATELHSRLHAELTDVTWLYFDASPPCVEELERLNRGRDPLLRATEAVIVVCPTAALVRTARSAATDLLASPDLNLRVLARDEDDWTALSHRLRAVMVQRHRTIDLTGLLPRDVTGSEVALEELYIDLLDDRQEVRPTPPGLQPLFRELHALFGDRLEFDVYTEEPAAVDRPTVVLAQPGAGKTTLLRHEVNAVAAGTSTLFPTGRVPVLVPLAGYAAARRERVQPLLAYCEAFAGEAVGLGRVPLRQHPDDVVFLLDGLDEIPDRSVRRRVLDEIIEWPERHGIRSVLLTGRSYLSPELERIRTSVHVRSLRSASDEDISHVLHAFARLRGRGRDPSALIQRIQADPWLTELARNPLLLVFLAVLDDVDRDLPRQRTVLYRDLTELLISRWQTRRNPGTRHRGRLRRGDAIRVLGPLGWWMVSRGGQPATEPELLEELTRIERKREPDAEVAARSAADRLAQLREDTALLFHDGRYAFAHLSFAEYFAGLEAARDPERRLVLEADPYSPDWREVVRFALVLLTDITCRDAEARQLATALIKRSRRPGRYDSKIPKLLSDIALEGPGLPSDLRQQMIARNTTISMRNALVPDEARAARAALMDAALNSHSAWAAEVRSAVVKRFEQGGPAPLDEDPLLERLPQLTAASDQARQWMVSALRDGTHPWLFWSLWLAWQLDVGARLLAAHQGPWWFESAEDARTRAATQWLSGPLLKACWPLWTRWVRRPGAEQPVYSSMSRAHFPDTFWQFVHDATGLPMPIDAAAQLGEPLIAELEALVQGDGDAVEA